MSSKKLSGLATILGTVLITLALLLPACSGTTTSSTPASVSVSPAPASKSAPAAVSSPTPPPTTAAAKTPKKGGVFRIIDGIGPSSTIGWYAEPTFRSGLWAPPVAEGLVECDLSGNVKPRLATDWEVASDLKSIKFTLRKGVKFQDGSDFNAAAAKWNLDQIIAAKPAGTADWISVDVVDDYTIRLNTKNYVNTMLNTLSSGTGFIVSPTAFQKVGAEGLRWNPVSTAPFKLANFKRDASVVYSRYNDYWQKDKPYVDSIEFSIISDMSTASMSFQAGNADAFNGNNTNIQNDLIQKGYSCAKSLDSNAFLMTDSKNADSPFSNVKVRQALDYAIDKDAITKARGFGFQEPTYQFALRGTSSFITNLLNRSYNPETAKKLLAEAGYPSGFKTTLYVDANIVDRDEAVAVQSFLGQVGIDADFQLQDSMKATNLKSNGWKNGILMSNEGIDANPNSTFSRDLINTPAYPTLLRTSDMNSLILASINSKNFDPELIKKVGQYMYDTSVITYLWSNSHVMILQPYVRDTGFLTLQTWPLWQPANVWLDK